MHRQLDNDNIMSNRHNSLLEEYLLPDIYAVIQDAADMETLCSTVNHIVGKERYDGYGDSRFFKVSL